MENLDFDSKPEANFSFKFLEICLLQIAHHQAGGGF
jgi:hypothetical protein